ncbi:MAG: CFI-box-CTERM domain-containing protein, partial [Candidatus Brocadiia bacterium]
TTAYSGINWSNIPKDAYVGIYLAGYYAVLNFCSSNTGGVMMSTYGQCLYQYGDVANSSFNTYSYTGAAIEFTMDSSPPAVTQMEGAYSLDGGLTLTSFGNAAPNGTKANTYDFTWNTQDVVSDNVFIGVRCYAGAWCSWVWEGPITVKNRLYVSITNNLGFGFVTVDGEDRSVPFTQSWYYREAHTIAAPDSLTKAQVAGRRWSWQNWSDGGAIVHDATMYWGVPALVQANYSEQVSIKVTTAYDVSKEFDGWMDVNQYVQFSVTSPFSISETLRYACSGWSGTGSVADGTGSSTGDIFLKDPTTIVWHWFPQYYLSITNEYGTNEGSQPGWYNEGATVRSSTQQTYALPAGARFYCFGWFAQGSIANGETIDTGNFTMTSPTTIAWIWIKQYSVTIHTNHGNTEPSGTVWVNENNLVTVEALPPGDTSTAKYTWVGWVVPGVTGYYTDTVLLFRVSQSASVSAVWLAQYYLTATTNGHFVGSYNGWYNEGTDVSIAVTQPADLAGVRFLLSWEATGVGLAQYGASFTSPNPYVASIRSPATVFANYVKQYSFEILNPQQAGVNMMPPVGTYWFFEGELAQGRVDFSYQGIYCVGYQGTGSVGNGTTPYFSVPISEPSTIEWKWTLRDVSDVPTPNWRDPLTVATNAFGAGCAIARNGTDNSPVVAYTGAPVASTKADGKIGPDSVRLGWVVDGVWRVDVIDKEGTFGEKIALALASDGTPYVAYVKDNEPCVGRYTESGWFIEVISADYSAENFISMVLDSDDLPHVAFYSNTNGALIYSYPSGGLWVSEVVDHDGNVGQYCTIGIMPILNWPSISYYDSTNGDLKFARKESGTWAIYLVASDGDVGRSAALALDPSGKPYIAYQILTNPVEAGLRIAWLQPEGWQIVDLSTNNITGYGLSMTIDKNGIIHMSYRSYAAVKYAWYNGIAWGIDQNLQVGELSGNTAITVDKDGYPSILYWDGADLKFVDTTQGAYTGSLNTDVTTLPSTGGGGGCFIATAAFGSLSAESVEVLCYARDAQVTSSSVGSDSVALYYAVSPYIAVETSDTVRAMIRSLLAR